jgi:hypothetical protein
LTGLGWWAGDDRGKLVPAIVLTVIGPVVTIGVALAVFETLGGRSDDVRRAGARQALALELKLAVTDMNGWQTAYGYDGGRRGARDRRHAAAAGDAGAVARPAARAARAYCSRLTLATLPVFASTRTVVSCE